jgi:hypothetical protein
MLPARLEYDLVPQGGGTVVTNTVELDVPPPLVLVSLVATRRIKPAVAENLAVLKTILERGE